MAFSTPSLGTNTNLPGVPSPSSVGLPNALSLLGGSTGSSGGLNGRDYAPLESVTIDPTLSANGVLTDLFFNWYKIDGTDFRSIYPYQFVITNNGSYVNHISLPIAPKNISMSFNTASAFTATMKGVTEDNNGAPFRSINVSGTSGVWHDTVSSGANNATSNSTLNYLFQNTINAANNVVTQFNKTVAAFTGSAQSTTGPLNYTPSDLTSNNGLTRSGHYYFHNLVKFFDYYVAKKKTRDGAGYRLTFQMHKDNMFYDVLFQGMDWQKPEATLEYMFNIKLMAYRRRPQPVSGVAAPKTNSQTTRADTLSTLASIINGIRQTRLLLAASSDVLTGIQSDAENSFFSPLREIALLGSDLAGIVTTLADMPQAIINSAKASVESAISDTTTAANNIRQSVDAALKSFGLLGDTTIPGSSALTSKTAVQATDGQSNFAVRPETAFPSEVIFQNPTKYAAVFDQFTLGSLTVPPAVSAQINAEIARVRALQVSDFQQRRTTMNLFANAIASSFGGGSAVYNAYLGLPPPAVTFQTLTTDDIEMLDNINDVLMSIDQVIDTLQQNALSAENDYYQFYGDYALSNGLDFQKGTSKFYVPFPPGGTLEMMALTYLGDYGRWIEIAALNGLVEPYVDETGFTVALITNSSASSVQVADVSNLFVDQIVTLQSNTQVGIPCQILAIERIGENQYLINLDTPGSIVGFAPANGAVLFAYTPDTINSTMLIAIPSATPVNVTGKIQLTPTQADLGAIAAIAQTDFLLTSDGDLALQANGDVQLSQGMTNLIQAATLRLQTPLGSLLQDATYGDPIQVGVTIADANIQNFLTNLSQQYAQDPRFTGILAGTVSIVGNAAPINILLGVSGTQLNLPISSQLPIG